MERGENIRQRVENLDGRCRQANVQLSEGQIIRNQKEYILKEHRDLGKHKDFWTMQLRAVYRALSTQNPSLAAEILNLEMAGGLENTQGKSCMCLPCVHTSPQAFCFCHYWRQELDGPLAWLSVVTVMFLCPSCCERVGVLVVSRSLAEAVGQTALSTACCWVRHRRDLPGIPQCFVHYILNISWREHSIYPPNTWALHQDGCTEVRQVAAMPPSHAQASAGWQHSSPSHRCCCC